MTRKLHSIVLLALLSSPAGASSIIVLGPSDDLSKPSIVSHGNKPGAASIAEPQSGPSDQSLAGSQGIIVMHSPSTIALGEPAVENGTVASIGARPHNPHLPPMVMRGGIVGEAFVRSAQGQAPSASQPSTAPGSTPAQPGRGPQPAQERTTASEPATPQPSTHMQRPK